MEQTILTKEGYQKLIDELDYLKSTRRQEVSEHLKVARGFGDLSENAEYDAAKDEQRELEARITTIEAQLKNAQVIETEGMEQSDVIGLGSTVKVLDEEFDEEMQFTIVGTVEANPRKNRISNESPLGASLIGSKVGDRLAVETPGGTVAYKVLEIVR
ncbi:MAG: transcription elongation factor GreA [Peptoniphilaceae bacterium]|nr:transcription elongation factor GreA [Peptoniphilaceae bacterium]